MSDHVTLREIVTNLLYPPRCLLCGTLCGWEELLCESCQKQQPQAGEFFWEPEVFGCRGILWCARYEGAFRTGMEQLKFEGVRESLSLFGGMLTEAVRQSVPEHVDLSLPTMSNCNDYISVHDFVLL